MTVPRRLTSSIAIPGIALLLTGCVSAEQAALMPIQRLDFLRCLRDVVTHEGKAIGLDPEPGRRSRKCQKRPRPDSQKDNFRGYSGSSCTPEQQRSSSGIRGVGSQRR